MIVVYRLFTSAYNIDLKLQWSKSFMDYRDIIFMNNFRNLRWLETVFRLLTVLKALKN